MKTSHWISAGLFSFGLFLSAAGAGEALAPARSAAKAVASSAAVCLQPAPVTLSEEAYLHLGRLEPLSVQQRGYHGASPGWANEEPRRGLEAWIRRPIHRGGDYLDLGRTID